MTQELLNKEESIFFEKLVKKVFKKKYPFIYDLKFVDFPQFVSENFYFRLNIFIKKDYIKNDERCERHFDMDSLDTKEDFTDWDVRIGFGASPYEMREEIMELFSYVKPYQKLPYLDYGEIFFPLI